MVIPLIGKEEVIYRDPPKDQGGNNNIRLSRRAFLKFAGLGAGAMFLAACGPIVDQADGDVISHAETTKTQELVRFNPLTFGLTINSDFLTDETMQTFGNMVKNPNNPNEVFPYVPIGVFAKDGPELDMAQPNLNYSPWLPILAQNYREALNAALADSEITADPEAKAEIEASLRDYATSTPDEFIHAAILGVNLKAGQKLLDHMSVRSQQEVRACEAGVKETLDHNRAVTFLVLGILFGAIAIPASSMDALGMHTAIVQTTEAGFTRTFMYVLINKEGLGQLLTSLGTSLEQTGLAALPITDKGSLILRFIAGTAKTGTPSVHFVSAQETFNDITKNILPNVRYAGRDLYEFMKQVYYGALASMLRKGNIETRVRTACRAIRNLKYWDFLKTQPALNPDAAQEDEAYILPEDSQTARSLLNYLGVPASSQTSRPADQANFFYMATGNPGSPPVLVCSNYGEVK